MKSVTDAFISTQASADATFVRRLYYKKRYWDQTQAEYAWTASWVELDQSEVVSISPVIWSLDTDQLNEFKVSNVTVVVDNSENKWREDNPAGMFGPSTGAGVSSYEPYWMKFQVRAGYVLSDGTTETVTVFTGVATEYTIDGTGKTCQISVQGLESLLIGTKAEAIATTVTEENAGTGNGATTAFTTLNPGVARITLVSVAGITVTEGTNYSVTNLNSATLGATVTFTIAPSVGQVVRISYSYWPQSQTFENLVSALVTAAGISGANQSIQSVIFSNSVINTFESTVKADFDAGTKTNIDTAFDSGKMMIDMSGTSMRQSTTWSTSTSGWTSAVTSTGTFTTDGTYVIGSGGVSGGQVRFYRSMTKAIGRWEFKYTMSNASCYFEFIFNRATALTAGSISHYSVVFDGPNSSIFTGGDAGSGVNYSHSFDTSEHTVIVVNNGINVFVYHDGVLIINEQVGFLYTPTYLGYFIAPGVSRNVKIREIYQPADTLSASWLSAVADSSSTPTAWGTFEYIHRIGSGTITYETQTSADNVSYDALVAVSGSVPQSTLRRYAKTKVSLSISSSAPLGLNYQGFNSVDVPYVDSVILRTTTSSTLVTLPNFSGQNAYEALQKLGAFTNYEFGFTPDEVFFFRIKIPGSSVMTLTQSDYIASLGAMDSGFSRAYGIVRVTYGSITKEITDDGLAATSASARFSSNRFEATTDSNIVIPASADIATGVAQQLFSLLSRPRKRGKVVTKFLPQLDLSDVITINFINNWPDQVWYLGDDNPSIYLGNDSLHLWGESGQTAYGLQGKIISARYDTNGRTCEFDFEEVLS